MIREKLWTWECKRGLSALPPARPLGVRQYPGALKGCGVKIILVSKKYIFCECPVFSLLDYQSTNVYSQSDASFFTCFTQKKI